MYAISQHLESHMLRSKRHRLSRKAWPLNYKKSKSNEITQL
jgi:hypothetical protein